jgi:predicted phosphodiesterase
MKIQYLSDLHLEFAQNDRYMQNNLPNGDADILLLSGDIVPLHDDQLNNRFFSHISQQYKQVYWVPGNHEFYFRNLAEYPATYNIPLFKNINLVNNVVIEIEGVSLIFSALWSHISSKNEKVIEQSVSDFRCIELNGRKLKAADFNELHKQSIDFITNALQTAKGKKVVVTHHVPSVRCNSDEHANSPINEAFCVDLTSFIEQCGANFWVYGHSHFNQKPLIIGKTMLLTNQLGYVHMNEQRGFNIGAYFVV